MRTFTYLTIVAWLLCASHFGKRLNKHPEMIPKYLERIQHLKDKAYIGKVNPGKEVIPGRVWYNWIRIATTAVQRDHSISYRKSGYHRRSQRVFFSRSACQRTREIFSVYCGLKIIRSEVRWWSGTLQCMCGSRIETFQCNAFYTSCR